MAINWPRIAQITEMLPCCRDRPGQSDEAGRSFGTAIDHRLKPKFGPSTFDSCGADAIERHSGCGPNPDIAWFHPITLSAKLDSHLCVLRYQVCALLRGPRSDN
jgi:hypothetical protein